MKLEDIINEALTYQWKDRYTDKVYTQKPSFNIYGDVIHIYTPVKPYKLVVLRRLLYIGKYNIKNIIVGYPDV